MLAHCRKAIVFASIVVGLFALVASCSKVPLLAPTGSVITLLPEATSVSLNSQSTIVATVIENGVATQGGNGSGTTTASRTGAGTPVQNGTVVTFTTTLGQIQPSEASTHNGQVQVSFITGNTPGTANITAYSGGASQSITLKVGSAAVKNVGLSAAPQSLPVSGGVSQLVATVTDDAGSPIGGVPVSFVTDHGTLSPATINTDGNGYATTVLSTTSTAKVTATAGSVTSTAITINVNSPALSSFTATPSSTSAGTPVTFAVAPATGVTIPDVRVDFGDGSSNDLGAISGPTSTSHPYGSAGIYTAIATPSDGTALRTQVVVGSLPVVLAAVPNPTTVDTPTTFTVSGTAAAAVDHYQWSWDDGTASFATSGPQVTHTFSSRGTKTIRVDVYGVGGGLLGSATLAITVQ